MDLKGEDKQRFQERQQFCYLVLMEPGNVTIYIFRILRTEGEEMQHSRVKRDLRHSSIYLIFSYLVIMAKCKL